MSKRRPTFTSPLERAQRRATALIIKPLNRFSPATRFLIGFSVLAVITTLLLANASPRSGAEAYAEGDVVRRTVVAPADFTIVDDAETARRRALAVEATHPVFYYDSNRGDQIANEFRAAWDDLKRQADTRAGNGATNDNLAPALKWAGIDGTEAMARAVAAHHFDPRERDRIAALLRDSLDSYVYDDMQESRLQREVALIDPTRSNGQPTIVALPPNRMVALSEARRSLEARIARLGNWAEDQRAALMATLVPRLSPNLIYNADFTEAAQKAAVARVAPVTVTIKRNQVIAREGDPVTGTMLAQLRAVQDYEHTGRQWQHVLGLLALVSAVYWVAWKFTEHRSAVTHLTVSTMKAFALVGASVLVELVLMRLGFTVADSIAEHGGSAPFSDPTIWSFAIPFASASLLVAMLVDVHLALITGLVTALFAGLLASSGVPMALYVVISSASAIYGIGRYRERQSVTLAGLVTGGANALAAIAVLAFAEEPFTPKTVLLAIGCGITGGLLTAIFTAGGLPINESFFGILTDVKLLELSNADLPVLGQLALRAPGTNQHSHAVGQLAEDACRVIGANPLLARIGALYHDIGKTAAPDMFVENQHGDNPHDRLKPPQSARIIISHVTYGLKLAKEIGLPKLITDFIPQHHGTRTLHFFLRKAQALAAPGETVNEAEFRYPGPKPQFKEAAIMMLADSCEAAARTLSRPDPESIRAIVNKIVEAILNDGQLDECNVTLRELTSIRESIITSLTAIYHARIDYPGFNAPRISGVTEALSHLDSEERGITYGRPSEVPINKGGEVEDEAVSRKAAKRSG